MKQSCADCTVELKQLAHQSINWYDQPIKVKFLKHKKTWFPVDFKCIFLTNFTSFQC